MLFRAVAIGLVASLCFAGCYRQTCTDSPVGPICSEPEPVQPPHTAPAPDHTATIAAVGAAVTAIALVVVLRNRHRNDEAHGAQATGPTDEERRLQRMFAQASLSARAGRCEAVTAISRKLMRETPAAHERLVADPAVARCLSPHS